MQGLYTLNKLIHKNMKNLLLILVVVLSLTGCTSIPKNEKWQPIKVVSDRREELRVGDIIIKNKVLKSPITWFGHAAMVVKPDTIGDYPMPGYSYYEIDTYSWLYETDRNVIVYRYKYFDETFAEKFQENLKKYAGKEYGISFKTNTETFYCSKYVWYVYYKTAKDLGYKLDIDSDGGKLVLPYDILGSKDFEQIYF